MNDLTDTVYRDDKNSMAGTGRQRKLLLQPSQTKKQISTKKNTKLITRNGTHTHARTHTHTHTNKNSYDEL